MRKYVSLVLAAVLLVSLFGCSSGGQEESTPPEITPQPIVQPLDTVEQHKIGTLASPDVLNMSNDDGAFGRMNYNSFCAAPFIEFGRDGTASPYLMTSWEVSEDNREIVATFAVDQGIRWHDGTPLTMDDIIFSMGVFQLAE